MTGSNGLYSIAAAIFDMDGLLIESESKWRQAEEEVSARLGLGLTEEDFVKTMGVRMADVADLWFSWRPWAGPSPAEVAASTVDRVIELTAGAAPLPGAIEAIELCRDAGLRLALCSSSDRRLIEAILDNLGLADAFEVVHSAEHDPFGKPHPVPYLRTAEALGLPARSCLAFEDSVAGCLAAKAAGMRVVAVPDLAARGSGRFGFCDLVLDTLEHFDRRSLDGLGAAVPAPSISRPRFHLAFGVHDLERARWFYGEVLGCPEGRSAPEWVDFDLWGHQIVAHHDPSLAVSSNTVSTNTVSINTVSINTVQTNTVSTSRVDGEDVPSRHFGLLLHAGAWHDVVARLQAAEIRFLIEPQVRFAGEPGEQLTCFVLDPSGNALEFKAFADDRAVFAA